MDALHARMVTYNAAIQAKGHLKAGFARESTSGADLGSYDRWEAEYRAYRRTLADFALQLEAYNTDRLRRLGGWRLPATPDVPVHGSGAPQRRDIQLGTLRNTAFTLSPLLSERECAAMIETADAIGCRPLVSTLTRSERSNTRAILTDPALAARLWAAVRAHVPPVVKSSEGEWVPYNVSEQLRLCRYLRGEHFGAHKDDRFKNRDVSLFSMMTIVIYLNDGFEGGRLNFLRHEGAGGVVASVRPAAGMACVFDQLLLHEGERLEAGTKWLLRADVVYIKKGVNRRAVHKHRAAV